MIDITVYGPPAGAMRHRSTRTGRHYHAPQHRANEGGFAAAFALALGGSPRPAIRGPVELRVVTWHARPRRRRRLVDAGAPAALAVVKPDVDNVAKLVMDAATKAGVWPDDTAVARLTVERWWLPLGAYVPADRATEHVGLERVEVQILPLPMVTP